MHFKYENYVTYFYNTRSSLHVSIVFRGKPETIDRFLVDLTIYINDLDH